MLLLILIVNWNQSWLKIFIFSSWKRLSTTIKLCCHTLIHSGVSQVALFVAFFFCTRLFWSFCLGLNWIFVQNKKNILKSIHNRNRGRVFWGVPFLLLLLLYWREEDLELIEYFWGTPLCLPAFHSWNIFG